MCVRWEEGARGHSRSSRILPVLVTLLLSVEEVCTASLEKVRVVTAPYVFPFPNNPLLSLNIPVPGDGPFFVVVVGPVHKSFFPPFWVFPTPFCSSSRSPTECGPCWRDTPGAVRTYNSFVSSSLSVFSW